MCHTPSIWYCTLADKTTGRGNFSMAFSFGAKAIEVEVDPGTGKVKLLSMVAAHDCGQPINPLAVEQQIQRSAMEANE